ncbi:MAG: Hsp20/alpha crystallin family protein [Bacteroidia bacterium]
MRHHTKHNHRLPHFTNWMNEVFSELDSNIGFNGANSVPQVNVSEFDDRFELNLAAPGYDKADFNLHQEKASLTISAKKEANEEAPENGKVLRREFHINGFNRKFTLPKTVDKDTIQATYTNGILTVKLPKKEEEKARPARNIEIL